jgi:hypothetical protein
MMSSPVPFAAVLSKSEDRLYNRSELAICKQCFIIVAAIPEGKETAREKTTGIPEKREAWNCFFEVILLK